MSESDKIRITISDRDKRFTANPRVPKNMKIDDFINDMIKKFNLPTSETNDKGQTHSIVYYLVNQSSGQELTTGTFASNGVKDGDELIVGNRIIWGKRLG
jgi:hypothetical protein